MTDIEVLEFIPAERIVKRDTVIRENKAVFISDIHLHPDMPQITHRFYSFIQWAAIHTKSVYILGDFLHAWPGDDAMDTWSGAIADQLAWLSSQGVSVYFMSGNRDFLVGKRFLVRANMQRLLESTVIQLGDEHVLLVHGDRYCTRDTKHQWLRRLTRNRVFTGLFLSLPYTWRARIVNQVREYSQMNQQKLLGSVNHSFSMQSSPMFRGLSAESMDPADKPRGVELEDSGVDIRVNRQQTPEKMAVVPATMIRHLRHFRVKTVIHGHTHQPGLTMHRDASGEYRQYVLSDWDRDPQLMCYNDSCKLHFIHFGDGHGC